MEFIASYINSLGPDAISEVSSACYGTILVVGAIAFVLIWLKSPQSMRAFTNILVKIGLLGTFIGIFIAISKFDASSTQNILNSIPILLQGLKLSFGTTVVAIGISVFVSVVFNVIELFKKGKTPSEIAGDMHTVMSTSNSMLASIAENSNKMTLILRRMSRIQSEDRKRMTVFLDKIEKNNSSMHEIGTYFSSDKHSDFVKSFDGINSKLTQQNVKSLVTSLGTIADNSATIKALIRKADDHYKSLESVNANMLKNYNESLKVLEGTSALVSDICSKLNIDPKDFLKISDSKLKDHIETFVEFSNMTKEEVENAQESIRKIVYDLRNCLEESGNCIRELHQEQRAGFKNELAEIKADLAKTVGHASSDVAALYKDVAQKHSSFLEENLQMMVDKTSEIHEQIVSVMQGMKN